jgi:hypothetical protein
MSTGTEYKILWCRHSGVYAQSPARHMRFVYSEALDEVALWRCTEKLYRRRSRLDPAIVQLEKQLAERRKNHLTHAFLNNL